MNSSPQYIIEVIAQNSQVTISQVTIIVNQTIMQPYNDTPPEAVKPVRQSIFSNQQLLRIVSFIGTFIGALIICMLRSSTL